MAPARAAGSRRRSGRVVVEVGGMPMRGVAAWAAGIYLIGLAAAGAPPASEPSPAPDPREAARVDSLLAEWERRSAAVGRLDATFTRTDADRVARRREEFAGRILLKAPNLACLDVRRRGPDGTTTFDERAVCDGREVAWYDGEIRSVLVVPFLEDLERGVRDLGLKDEAAPPPAYLASFLLNSNVGRAGLAPFLFGVKAGEFRRRYQIRLIAETSATYHLRLLPRGAVERGSFAEALLDLSKETFLPDTLRLTSPDGRLAQHYTVTAATPNAPIEEGNFAIRLAPGWKVVRTPGLPARPASPPR